MTVEWEVPPNNTILDGIWRVGEDIQPGLYQTLGSDCYWARLSNFTGKDDIIANGFTSGPTVVQISPRDTGFDSSSCGTWARIGD